MEHKIKKPEAQEKYCQFCEKTGIILNEHYQELGEAPLAPCPRCVVPTCKCNGEEPYYVYDNDQIQVCPCRETRLKIERIKSIYYNSGIDRRYLWKTFSDFKVQDNKLAGEAKNFAYDIVNKFPHIDRGLYLWGNPGTGKTLLSTIILTDIIRHHAVEGRFIKISRTFFNRLKATFNQTSETYGESSKIEKEYASVDVLVIDDFGVQRDSPWEQETLYNLVDARYEAKKFTIFTSNVDPNKAFRELSEGRVLSRIREMCRIMELSGKDFREAK